jgi:TPR repeat protein
MFKLIPHRPQPGLQNQLSRATWMPACSYAFLLYTGTGVNKDISQAVEIFKKAALVGHVQAQLNLGIHYTNTSKDEARHHAKQSNGWTRP